MPKEDTIKWVGHYSLKLEVEYEHWDTNDLTGINIVIHSVLKTRAQDRTNDSIIMVFSRTEQCGHWEDGYDIEMAYDSLIYEQHMNYNEEKIADRLSHPSSQAGTVYQN